jgi:hypothetical protein
MGHSRPLAYAGIALACSVGTACLLVTDLDGLAGGSRPDSGPPSDVAAPSADADLDAKGACAVLFCADWDESDDVRHGWSNPEVSGGGSIALDVQSPRSPPHAFAAIMAPQSGYDGALLAKYYSFGANALHLAAYVYFDQLDTSQNTVSFATFGVFGGQPPFSHIRVSATSAGVEFAEEYRSADAGDQAQHVTAAYTWPLRKWLRLDVDVDVPSRAAKMSVDGAQVAALTLVGTWSQTETALKLGIYYSKGQGGQRILYDDVAFDAK